jgi:hypothetical protein
MCETSSLLSAVHTYPCQSVTPRVSHSPLVSPHILTRQSSYSTSTTMKTSVLILAWLATLGQDSSAWVAPSISSTSRKTAAFRHSTSSWMVSNLEDSTPEFTSSSTRRQWLTGMVTAAGCLPLLQHVDVASAADIVTTTAVCDPAVSVWQRKGRFVYILGTAHVSAVSAELAGQLVRDIHPNAVFVELDPKRVSGDGILANRMTEDGKEITSKIIVPQIQVIDGPPPMMAALGSMATAGDIPAAATTVAPPPNPSQPNPIMRAATAAVGNSIKSMYKKLDSSGLKSGEEFVVTMQEGQRMGSDIILGDRDVEVTLQRVTEALSKTDIKALMNPGSDLEQSMKELAPPSMAMNGGGDLNDPQFRDEFSSFVEVMKSRENVRKIMVQLQTTAPALYQALVGERDAYMAAGLNGLNSYEAIVAVMGIAHVDGVEQNLKLNGWKAVSLNCAIKR